MPKPTARRASAFHVTAAGPHATVTQISTVALVTADQTMARWSGTRPDCERVPDSFLNQRQRGVPIGVTLVLTEALEKEGCAQ